MILFLILWLVPAVTLVHPYRKYVVAGYSNAIVRWATSAWLALFWPVWGLMILRRKYLEAQIG